MLSRQRRVWWCWFVVLGACGAARAQSGSIRGVVIDDDFGAPLPAAQVTIAETGVKVQTTDQGSYVFEQVEPGTYTLVFSKDGYVRQVKGNVLVTPGQLTEVEARLAGEFTDMDEFIVEDLVIGGGTEAGLLQLRLEAPALVDSISAELLSKAGASDAAQALTFVSGATVQDGKFAVIRGLPDRYVNSQLNGVRLPSADDETRAVELDQFPAAVIESVQVTKTFTPDQQGDASGGAVNVVLKGVPEKNFIQFSSSIGYNTNVGTRDDFLTYKGGGVTYLGFNQGDNRQIDSKWSFPRDDENPGSPNDGLYGSAVGVSRGDAPIDYKYGLTLGLTHEFDNGVRIGGLGSFFYEQEASYYDDGLDEEYQVSFSQPGTPLERGGVRDLQSGQSEGNTAIFDITQGSHQVQWGSLGAIGLESQYHDLSVNYLYTRTSEDVATLEENTRGKSLVFPGFDPNDPSSPGFSDFLASPYRRRETLEYTERTTQTLQLIGRHELPFFSDEGDTWIRPVNPEIDWKFARSEATLLEPDKRFFESIWFPIDATTGIHLPPQSSSGSNGNLQRTFREIEEVSNQYQVNLKLPFLQWTDTKGFIKFGVFNDEVNRDFGLESFNNQNSEGQYTAPFDDFWSAVYPNEVHYLQENTIDVDYSGQFNVDAVYWMIDMPLTEYFKLIGGIRYENTAISTVVDPDRLPDGTINSQLIFFPAPDFLPVSVRDQSDPTRVADGVDVDLEQSDRLPAFAFEYDLFEKLTLRGAYSETVARPTFRELTPVVQQEFLGGDIFVGNPSLKLASLKNYDLRLDYRPTEGSLYSVSYFYKAIRNPIEITQTSNSVTSFFIPVNFPEGLISGVEVEARQDLGVLWERLTGLTLGANATLIDSQVTLSADERQRFLDVGRDAPTTRDATGAPEFLYNLFGIYNFEPTGTELAVFYTVRGDTLIAGSAFGGSFFTDIYETEYGTLNLSVTQKLGKWFKLKFQAKNLTNPEIQEVFRYQDQEAVRSSFTRGIDLSLSFTAEFEF